MSLNKPYKHLIYSLIPETIRTNYPKYVQFVQEYLALCEEESGPFEVILSLPKLIDITVVDEDLLFHYLNQYISSFPNKLIETLNIRDFIKNAKTFYSNKGNEQSFRFIFNLLKGTVRFFYPYKYIFTISNDQSMLSGSLENNEVKEQHHRIHDNDYWAYYTYEISSDLDLVKYDEILRRTVHPAGFKLFSKKIIEIVGESGSILSNEVLFEKDVKLQIQHLEDLKPHGLITSEFGSNLCKVKSTLSGIIEFFYSIKLILQKYVEMIEKVVGYYATDYMFSYTMWDFYGLTETLLLENGLVINNTDYINIQRAADISLEFR